ncbi:UPAR/Ly6 domain-containing protein crok-like [Haliotis asinina]|uniref:UPAR/Ly6 domain-containing protein crok-like n=1 Tax=Haliotis asinina TaxID=109174 RepID=UPI003531AAC5
MKTILATVALTVAVFVILDTGSAIKCFQCNSYHQHDCADWFDNVTQHLTQCQPHENLCRKVVQEVYYDGSWEVRYVRQCASAGEIGMYEGRVCQERLGTYRVKMRYCHCDNQDGCNSGAALTTLTPVIVGIFVTLFQYVLPKL